MDAAWLDGLEKKMSEVLLGHLRNRLTLIREAEDKFRRRVTGPNDLYHRTCCTRPSWTGIAWNRHGWLSDCWFNAPHTM